MNILKQVTISANRFARGVGRRLLLLRPKRSPLRRFPDLLRRTSTGQDSLLRPTSARPSLRGRWKLTNYARSKTQARPATRLNYGLYLPHLLGSSPIPPVVLLHGCQQTTKEFAQGTRMNVLAEQEGFAVRYPRAA